MTQPQAQTNQSSSSNVSRAATAPTKQSRALSSATRDPMAVWAANPLYLMQRLSDDMDELFGQLVGGPGGTSRGLAAASPTVLAPAVDWIPAIDTFESDGKLVIRADLPGIGAQDVTVEVADGMLTLSGERREEREIGSDGARRTELRYGRFTRGIALPEGTRDDEVEATFHNGVLEITVPLPKEAAKGRKVDVKSVPGSDTADKPNSASPPAGS